MVKLSGTQWVIALVLSLVWGVIGYALSEKDRRRLGSDPLGPPFGPVGLSLVLSLYCWADPLLIAHASGMRRAQQPPPFPHPSSVRRRRWTGTQPDCGRAVPLLPEAGKRAGKRDRLICRQPPRAHGAGPGHHVAPLAPRLAPGPERAISLPLVGRHPVDVPGVDGRSCRHRHQPGSAHRALLSPSGRWVAPGYSAPRGRGGFAPVMQGGCGHDDCR